MFVLACLRELDPNLLEFGPPRPLCHYLSNSMATACLLRKAFLEEHLKGLYQVKASYWHADQLISHGYRCYAPTLAESGTGPCAALPAFSLASARHRNVCEWECANLMSQPGPP